MLSPGERMYPEEPMFPEKTSGENVWMIHVRSDLNCCLAGNILYLSENSAVCMISFMTQKITLHGLFPDLRDGQIEEIAELLHGYCSTVWRIYERLEREHPEIIDDLMKTSSMKAKVDSSQNTP